jgi:hypothetical protein
MTTTLRPDTTVVDLFTNMWYDTIRYRRVRYCTRAVATKDDARRVEDDAAADVHDADDDIMCYLCAIIDDVYYYTRMARGT